MKEQKFQTTLEVRVFDEAKVIDVLCRVSLKIERPKHPLVANIFSYKLPIFELASFGFKVFARPPTIFLNSST